MNKTLLIGILALISLVTAQSVFAKGSCVVPSPSTYVLAEASALSDYRIGLKLVRADGSTTYDVNMSNGIVNSLLLEVLDANVTVSSGGKKTSAALLKSINYDVPLIITGSGARSPRIEKGYKNSLFQYVQAINFGENAILESSELKGKKVILRLTEKYNCGVSIKIAERTIDMRSNPLVNADVDAPQIITSQRIDVAISVANASNNFTISTNPAVRVSDNAGIHHVEMYIGDVLYAVSSFSQNVANTFIDGDADEHSTWHMVPQSSGDLYIFQRASNGALLPSDAYSYPIKIRVVDFNGNASEQILAPR